MQVVSFGPDISGGVLADFFYGYHYGNTAMNEERLTRNQFTRRIRKGQIICHAVFVRKVLVAVMGTASRIDDRGPYVEIQFFLGDLGRHFRAALCALAARVYDIARHLAADRLGLYSTVVRVRVRGRKGWRRALKSIAVIIDQDGWCVDFDPTEWWAL